MTTKRRCPTCSVEVPERTGKYCPACGSEMDGTAARLDMPAAAPMAAPAARTEFAGGLPGLEQEAFGKPIALAVAGAFLGALCWALIMFATGYEIGYVAWGLGALVGAGAVYGGGRGTMHAVLAAALTLLGIAGGKCYGTHLLVEQQMGVLEASFDRAAFENMREMASSAEATPAAPGEESWLEAIEEEGLTADQAAAAASEVREMLANFRDPGFTFERWRDEQIASLRGQVSIGEIVCQSLNFIDLIFVMLGLSTAFTLVRRASVQATA